MFWLTFFCLLLTTSCHGDSKQDVCSTHYMSLSVIPNQVLATHQLYLHENDPVIINCTAGHAASGTINTYLKWIRWSITQQQIIPFTTAVEKILPDLHFKPICDVQQLYIEHVTADDAGVYICSRKDTMSTNVTIHVYDTSSPTVKLNVPSLVTLKENEKLSITCYTSGSPLPIVRWNNAENVIKECQQTNCTLIVIGKRDTNYTCSVENKYGSASKLIQVNVIVVPEMKGRGHLGVYSNKLECTVVRAVPLPNIFWQHRVCNKQMKDCETTWRDVDENYKQVPPYGVATNQSTLSINGDGVYGIYRCMAVNEAGNSSDTMQVAIHRSADDVELLAGAISAVLFFVIVVFVIGFVMRRRLRRKHNRFFSFTDYQVQNDVDLMEQSAQLPYDTRYEYPRNKLEFIKVLGAGAFGQVWLARASHLQYLNQIMMESIKRKNSIQDVFRKSNKNNNKTSYHSFVAVKTLKDDASEVEYKDLASEIKVLIHLGKHKHTVNLLGACTKGGSLFAIMEYCPYGDMKNFLKARRNVFLKGWEVTNHDMYSRQYTLADSVMMAREIACGMAFLHSKKLIHRDLACRNILLGDEYCIKISDFGLARDVCKDDNYVKTTSGMLPVKWMSPESLFDKMYNTKTDIWSFSIVLWEIFTLGGSPYPGIPIEDLFTYIRRGKRMGRPDTCPLDCFQLMNRCWSKKPDDRPAFSDIMNLIDSILKKNLSDDCFEKMTHRTRDDLNSSNSSIYVRTPEVVKRSKKFSFNHLFSPSKRVRSSGTEDHLLSRLSSTNSDVFDRA